MIKHPDLPDAGIHEQIALLGHAELPYFDQDEVHDIYREWRELLDSYRGDRIGVAEAWASTSERLARYVRPDELHQAFNFALLEAPWSSPEFRKVIDDSTSATGLVGATTTWVLGNHDVWRPVTRYGDGETGLRRARAAALLSFALPGSVYVYQGEELGLAEVLDLPEDALQDPKWARSGYTDRGRDGCRVPVPWEGARPPFGFSAGDSWLPMPARWRSWSVRDQREQADSVLATYRHALRVRRAHPALGDGDYAWIEAPTDTLAFRREPGLLCAINFAAEPVTLDVTGRLLAHSQHGELTEDRRWDGTLPGETTVWVEED